jgi:hypothetical protein
VDIEKIGRTEGKERKHGSSFVPRKYKSGTKKTWIYARDIDTDVELDVPSVYAQKRKRKIGWG